MTLLPKVGFTLHATAFPHWGWSQNKRPRLQAKSWLQIRNDQLSLETSPLRRKM